MKKFYLFLSFIFVFYCSFTGCKSKNLPNMRATLPPLVIDYNSCTPTGGCTVYLSQISNQSLLQQVSMKLAQKTLFSEGSKPPILATNPAVSINFTDITLSEPNLFYTLNDVNQSRQMPSEWFPRQRQCEERNIGLFPGFSFKFIECKNFMPIGTMVMVGTVTSSQSSSFLVGAQISNQQTSILADKFSLIPIIPGFTVYPCGTSETYTTYQNMYQCNIVYSSLFEVSSAKPGAGFGNGLGGYVPFANEKTPNSCPVGSNCDPDQNWFLTSCPDYANDLNQCSWLSPIITTDNPAAGTGGYDSNLVPMANLALDPNSSTYSTDRLTKGRLLWSGEIADASQNNIFNFFEVNGNNPRNTSPDASYNFYAFLGDTNKAIQQNQGGTSDMFGPLILAPGSVSATVPVIDNSFLSLYNMVGVNNICEVQSQSNSLPPSTISTYNWQIPSYSMMYTLTGGGATTPYCEQGGDGFIQNLYSICNFSGPFSNKIVHGFRAMDSLPGFLSVSNFPEYLMSSSLVEEGVTWIFGKRDSSTLGSLDIAGLDLKTKVRCSSSTW